MSEKQTTSLQLDNTTYTAAYEEQGSGAVLLFLHGFLGSSACWEAVVAELADHYYCIRLDMLGFGNSSKPMIHYDIDRLVGFVHAFVEQQNLQSITLVGHSLGGWVAAAYALRYPLQNLVLVAPAGIRDDSFCGRYNYLRPLLWRTPVVDWGLGLTLPLWQLLGRRESLEYFWKIRRRILANPAAYSFLVHRLRPEDAFDTVEKDIHQIPVPTRVIAGALDDTIPLWHCETYADRIPQADLIVLPQAGHDLPQRHGGAIAQQISTLISATAHKAPL